MPPPGLDTRVKVLTVSSVDFRRATVSLAIALTLVSACGGSDAGNGNNASAQSTSTTKPRATTTTLAVRTELGAAEPPDALVVEMGDYFFAPTELRISDSTLKVALRNISTPCPNCPPKFSVHDFYILDPATGLPMARSERLDPGKAGVFVVEGLKPGSYRFICSLHGTLEMNGTLEVTA